MNLQKTELSQGPKTLYPEANTDKQGISVVPSSQAHAKQGSAIFNSSGDTSLLTREADTDFNFGIEIIKQKAIEKLKENYNAHKLIEINDLRDFECLNELVKSGEISLAGIQTIRIVASNEESSHKEATLMNNVAENKNAKRLIDMLLNYLTENENKLVSLQSLKLLKPYMGHLTIPTFAFELKEFEIGTAISLTIKSQPSLESITTARRVHNNLIIEEQKELKKLCMNVIEQGEKGAQIAIQPKLSSLQINYCNGDFSLENQPSLQKIDIKRFWGGLLMITKEQKELLNAPECYDPCMGRGKIMVTKSLKDLEKPVPMEHLLTLGHLKSLISINTNFYFAAVVVAFVFEKFTPFYITFALLMLKNIIQEMQRIYSIEKKMMYIA